MNTALALIFVFAMWPVGTPPDQAKYYQMETEQECQHLVEYAYVAAGQYAEKLQQEVNLVAHCTSMEELRKDAI